MTTILFATIYPEALNRRAETEITGALLRSLLALGPGFRIKAVIASAHRSSLVQSEAFLAGFTALEKEFLHVETPFAGTRPEEISACKERLSHELAAREFDYLLFMDADVWTSLSCVPAWIQMIADDKANAFIKIKYCLRSVLSSPAHTLGAYFHHKQLLDVHQYWTSIYPRRPDGARRGAPDCALHAFLEKRQCRKIVPPDILTHHFLDRNDANTFFRGKCFRSSQLRKEGRLVFGLESAPGNEVPGGSGTSAGDSGPKVFGIGLSRSGGGTLSRWLADLGYRTVRFPKTLAEIQRHRASVGVNVTSQYQALDRSFPNSKFICLTREKAGWLKACEAHWRECGDNVPALFRPVRKALYGGESFSPHAYAAAYDRFVPAVQAHFQARMHQLLCIDISHESSLPAVRRFLSA